MDNCSVSAACVTPIASIELRYYEFPNPNEMIMNQDRPILSLATPRADRRTSRARFVAETPYCEIGAIILRPPGVALHASGLGGPSRQLVCEYDGDAFERMTGLTDWDSTRLLRCIDIQSTSMDRTMRRLIQEIERPGFGTEMLSHLLSQTLLVDLARFLGSQPDDDERVKGGLARWQIRRIDETLHGSVGEWTTVNKLAKEIGISRYHLSRSFRQTTGRSLVEHCTTIRMSRAEALLSQNDMSISEIARHLGFSSANSFSTSFRREAGVSPTKFMRSHPRRGASAK